MPRSTDRILTTHTGSLPRPADVLELIQARESGQPVMMPEFDACVGRGVGEIVQKQVDAGIDIVSDGELSKPSFATYVAHRFSGFGGENADIRVFADREAFPGFSDAYPGSAMKRRLCIAPIAVADADAVTRDIQNLQAALAAHPGTIGFVPAASPGIISDVMANRYYESDEAYLFALADALKHEYRAITDAGLTLQIDAPDAALARHVEFRNHSLAEFQDALALRVAALNHALDGIPEEQVRFHICWGNYEGPHTHDVALRDIVDLVLQVHAGAYSIEASNPRHAHEWHVWEEVNLPGGKVLIPGVIDSTTNFVEHPMLVADRIEQFARVVGLERVIAGTDCGFGTSAGRSRVHPEIVWAKLGAMAEGARIASERLWS
jgi:5-methyltetrahydropteroyltriglutamate--homocysteine methyltransferase